jgi:hypothetical protein
LHAEETGAVGLPIVETFAPNANVTERLQLHRRSPALFADDIKFNMIEWSRDIPEHNKRAQGSVDRDSRSPMAR